MIKALKVLIVSALTLACLYVALIFVVGIAGGFSRYSPDIHRKNMRRYPAPQRYEPERQKLEDPAVDEEMTENKNPTEGLSETSDTRDS